MPAIAEVVIVVVVRDSIVPAEAVSASVVPNVAAHALIPATIRAIVAGVIKPVALEGIAHTEVVFAAVVLIVTVVA